MFIKITGDLTELVKLSWFSHMVSQPVIMLHLVHIVQTHVVNRLHEEHLLFHCSVPLSAAPQVNFCSLHEGKNTVTI